MNYSGECSDSSSNFDFDDNQTRGSISSFDFGSDSEELVASNVADVEEDVAPTVSSDSGSLMSFSLSIGDDEELWDSESSDENTSSNLDNDTVKNVLHGTFLSLNFFQLFFKVSERAMIYLLRFFQLLFAFLARVTKHTLLVQLANRFPLSLHSIRKFLVLTTSSSTQYVVCSRCSTLYQFNSLDQSASTICSHIEFPNHPHVSRRKVCGTPLLKSIRVGHRSKLVPRKLFVYNSVIESLKKLVLKPNFLNLCDHWRDRSSKLPPNFMGDIYEGKVWKSLHEDGEQYLSSPNNLCLCLNIDWFNPYDETPYSAGAIYLTILNLPRTERFKTENIILAGIIPGPNEPKNCNGFLKPLVDDLNSLFQGVNMNSQSGNKCVRAMLICISCDLPATRKVCGFYNYNARYGCSKCLKEFVTVRFGDPPNYGGYDCENWPVRDKNLHRVKALDSMHANSAAARTRIEQSYGARYSEFLCLPYFDIVRHHVIDPMHNIFLGLTKHTMKTWKELDILSDSAYPILQSKVDSITPPSKMGRIPRKVQAGFVSFTADEWKNWLLFYSIFTLHGIIPERDFRCWCLLVESCQLLCQLVLTTDHVTKAHDLLVEFCKTFENLYGSKFCTPNMHVSCHLKDCILDYGPLSSFWCFPFERLNGFLEGFQKSWDGPEKQMSQKFLTMQHIYDLLETHDQESFVGQVCKNSWKTCRGDSVGSCSSVDQTTIQDETTLAIAHNMRCPVSSLNAAEESYQCLARPFYEKCFSESEFTCIKTMYFFLYPDTPIKWLSRLYLTSKKMVMNGEEYISEKCRSGKSSLITACWPGVVSIDSRGESLLRVGMVECFIKHKIELENGGSSLAHNLVRVNWFQDHPRRSFLHKSAICCSAVHEPESEICFMPVSRIAGRCAFAKTVYDFDYGRDSIIVCIPWLKFHVLNDAS